MDKKSGKWNRAGNFAVECPIMKRFNIPLFASLFIVSFIAALAQNFLVSIAPDVALSTVEIVFIAAQAAILLAIVIALGMFFSRRVGLGLPYLAPLLERMPVPTKFWKTMSASALIGLAVGAVIVLLELFAFRTPLSEAISTTPVWLRFFAAVYGGLNEELLTRFFFLSLMAWFFGTMSRGADRQAVAVRMVTAIVITALVFSIGQLPLTSIGGDLPFSVVLRALLLNGIANVVFGWLYWKKGLESAMTAHFVTDIILFLFVPFLAAALS